MLKSVFNKRKLCFFITKMAPFIYCLSALLPKVPGMLHINEKVMLIQFNQTRGDNEVYLELFVGLL